MSEQNSDQPWGMEVNTFCMLMHLSQFANFLVPFAGLVLPIVMWATNKEKHPIVDQHGKVILNWMISALIYFIISGILTMIFIGVLGMLAVAICGIVFAIIGAVKANEGKVWVYPLSIRFFSVGGTTA